MSAASSQRTGARGALLDEYERSVRHLIAVMENISGNEMVTLVDPKTENPDCRSVQTILTHVVNSGYAYASYIRKHCNAPVTGWVRTPRQSISEYRDDLGSMMDYTAGSFDYFDETDVEEQDNDKKMLTHWGQRYDIEQLLEHAIVHILRHRRQIERFLAQIRQ